MAAPNGMAPAPGLLTEQNVAIILRALGPSQLAQYQAMSGPEKQLYLQNILKQWSAKQAAQTRPGAQAQQQAGPSAPPQQQQQQQQQFASQQQQVRPQFDLNALAQAQALIKAQGQLGQQQQQQNSQRVQGQQVRPEGMPISLNYTPEQMQSMQNSNPQIAQLLRSVQAAGGQMGQIPPGTLQQANQLLQSQQMQNQNHIQMQQSPHMGQMPMPRTPSQAHLGMQRNGSAQGGPMQHPSSPAAFSSPQVNQQSPLQGTPQHHNMALGGTNQLGAQIPQRPNQTQSLTPQQIKAWEMMQQNQALRGQAGQTGQQRPPMRPPMNQQQQQQQLQQLQQQQAFAAARNGQMPQNGQVQGMQVRPTRPPMQAAQGFSGGPPAPVVNQIVDNLQAFSQMRDQDELDATQKEALNTVISNPAVLQSAFLGRAAKAQEEKLSAVSAELGRVQGNSLDSAHMAQLQAIMANPQIPHEQKQNMMTRLVQQGVHLPMQQMSAEEPARRSQAPAAGGDPAQNGRQGPNGNVPSPATVGHDRQGSMGSVNSRAADGQPGAAEMNQQRLFFAKMHGMSEEKREMIYQKTPQLRNWYNRQMQQHLQRAHENRIEPEVAHAQAQISNNPAMQGQLQAQQMPLPNLQLPLNRARGLSQQGNGLPIAGGNAAVAQAAAAVHNAQQNAMVQQQLQAVVAQAQTAIQQQQNNVAHSQSQSPNPQGTPVPRANGSFSAPRGSTPAFQAAMAANNAAMGQRPSPQMRQGPLTGTPPANGMNLGTQMDLQMRMQGNMPPNGAEQARQGGLQAHPQTPNIPHGFQKVELKSLVIPDKLDFAESASLPFPNAEGPRPTLSVGLVSGPVTGLPALEARPAEFEALLNSYKAEANVAKRANKYLFSAPKPVDDESEDAAQAEVAGPSTAVDARPSSPPARTRASKKRTIGEIAKHVDRELRVTEGSEDFLLELTDEFLESVAEAGCRLAKLRKGARLEVKDLQMHLERDYNIFIPGFAYDALRVDQAPFLRKNPPVPGRAARLAAVQQARRDGAPINKAPAKHAQASVA